jgi:trk system potassium uptake protein TrkA
LAEHETVSVVVAGLGRFGGQVAETLLQLGHEVLGIDEDDKLVQQWSDRLTHVVQADATDEDALRQLGIKEFSRAVVGIGTDIEASVLTVLTLSELGLTEIWAKAISAKHGKILKSVGAHHVVYPEATMGDRVARLLADRMLDLIELDGGAVVATTRALGDTAGRSVAHLDEEFGVTVMGFQPPGSPFTRASPDAVVPDGSTLIVAGGIDQVQGLATSTHR